MKSCALEGEVTIHTVCSYNASFVTESVNGDSVMCHAGSSTKREYCNLSYVSPSNHHSYPSDSMNNKRDARSKPTIEDEQTMQRIGADIQRISRGYQPDIQRIFSGYPADIRCMGLMDN